MLCRKCSADSADQPFSLQNVKEKYHRRFSTLAGSTAELLFLMNSPPPFSAPAQCTVHCCYFAFHKGIVPFLCRGIHQRFPRKWCNEQGLTGVDMGELVPAESLSWGQMGAKAEAFCLHQQVPVTRSGHRREPRNPQHQLRLQRQYNCAAHFFYFFRVQFIKKTGFRSVAEPCLKSGSHH